MAVHSPRTAEDSDRKTGEHVDFLFAHRAKRLAKTYINAAVIPSLCRKAGVPAADVRGNITSHRARSTIATQLYNAKEPMTLFELQAWLGHRSADTTQNYAKITPNTLSRAYSDAGYFERNVRTIEVLIDRQAAENGAAASGEPWQYYDLGHGYCGYTFFEQCPHRMACAKCDFYTPKDSSKALLLEARDNLQRCSPRSPSLTTSEPPSTTARPLWTNSSVSWPTPLRRQDQSAPPRSTSRGGRAVAGHRGEAGPEPSVLRCGCPDVRASLPVVDDDVAPASNRVLVPCQRGQGWLRRAARARAGQPGHQPVAGQMGDPTRRQPGPEAVR